MTRKTMLETSAALIPGSFFVKIPMFQNAHRGVASVMADSQISVGALPHVSTDSSEIQLILNLVFVLLGVICLLVVTLAGFRYIVSRGEPQEIARAKNTIIYALVGLAIAILAFSIVNFVVGQL